MGEDLLADLATGAVGQRELEVLLEELLDVGAADGVVVLDLNNLQDLQGKGRLEIARNRDRVGKTYVDGAETGTVTGSHVLVESLNSLGAGHLTELLVHVVGAGARVVADPDTEVLDLEGTLLRNLDGGKKSRSVPFHFVPRAGLGFDIRR